MKKVSIHTRTRQENEQLKVEIARLTKELQELRAELDAYLRLRQKTG